MGYVTMYVGIGSFQYLRKVMNKEFKRVGVTKAKDKYGYFMQVLGYAPTLNNMSISEMEIVITELQKLPDAHFGHLIEEAKREKKEPNEFSLYVKNQMNLLGWSTRMFANITGISEYRMARIGTGTIEATEEEMKRIKNAVERWEN